MAVGGRVEAVNSKRRGGSMRDTVTQTEIRHASQRRSERVRKEGWEREEERERKGQRQGWTGQTGAGTQGWAYAVRVDCESCSLPPWPLTSRVTVRGWKREFVPQWKVSFFFFSPRERRTRARATRALQRKNLRRAKARPPLFPSAFLHPLFLCSRSSSTRIFEKSKFYRVAATNEDKFVR